MESEPVGLVDPDGQARHTLVSEAPLAGGVLDEYVFAAHVLQAVPSQYRPATHLQSDAASDPAVLLDEAGQARHTVASAAPLAVGVLVEYVPPTQFVQALPSQYRPALHTQSEAASEPAGLVDDVGQAWHTL